MHHSSRPRRILSPARLPKRRLLRSFKRLRLIDGGSASGLTGQGLVHLTDLPQLTTLSLGSDLSPEGKGFTG